MFDAPLSGHTSISDTQRDAFVSGTARSSAQLEDPQGNWVRGVFAGRSPDHVETTSLGAASVSISAVRVEHEEPAVIRLEIVEGARTLAIFVRSSDLSFVVQGSESLGRGDDIIAQLRDADIRRCRADSHQQGLQRLLETIRLPEAECVEFEVLEPQLAAILERLWLTPELHADNIDDAELEELRSGCMRVLVDTDLQAALVFFALEIPRDPNALPMTFEELTAVADNGLGAFEASDILRLMSDSEAVMSLTASLYACGQNSPWEPYVDSVLAKDWQLQESVKEAFEKTEAKIKKATEEE